MNIESRILRLTKRNNRKEGKLLLAEGRRILPIGIKKKRKKAKKTSLKLRRAKITRDIRKL